MSKVEDKILIKMSELLKITSDPTRLKIMHSLLDDSKCTCTCSDCGECHHRHCMIEKCVNDISNDINASQSLVSHQLKILKDAELVNIRKEGTKNYYMLKDGHVKQLLRVVFEHASEE